MDSKYDNDYINEYTKEENINKKNNTFNLIIGVATLIIALLGTSFAYFTMTNGSAENEIAVKSSYVSIVYEGGTKVEADDLIPTNENVMLWAYQDPGRIAGTCSRIQADGSSKETTCQCVDSKNQKVCYVYQFVVRSDGEGESTDILGIITVNQNEFVEEIKDENDEVIETKSGLSYMVFELEEDATGTTKYKKVSGGTEASINPKDVELYAPEGQEYKEEFKFARFGFPIKETTEEGTVNIRGVNNYLFGSTGHIDITNNVDHVFQLVIWLHDDNYDQNREQDKGFAGTIKINVRSGDNDGGTVTGTKEEPTDEPSDEPTEEPTE